MGEMLGDFFLVDLNFVGLHYIVKNPYLEHLGTI